MGSSVEHSTRPVSVTRQSADLSIYVEARSHQGSRIFVNGPLSGRSLLPVALGYGVAKLLVSKVSLLIVVPDRE